MIKKTIRESDIHTYNKCINRLTISSVNYILTLFDTNAIIRQLRVDIGIELVKILIDNFDTINLLRKKNKGEQCFS